MLKANLSIQFVQRSFPVSSVSNYTELSSKCMMSKEHICWIFFSATATATLSYPAPAQRSVRHVGVLLSQSEAVMEENNGNSMIHILQAIDKLLKLSTILNYRTRSDPPSSMTTEVIDASLSSDMMSFPYCGCSAFVS